VFTIKYGIVNGMDRIQIESLKKWYSNEDRKPLILRGARQVGKSTLVRLFCEKEKIHLLELNLEKKGLKTLKNSNIELEKLINELEDLFNFSFLDNGKKYLLFLDEIQARPEIFAYLRYFYEERFDIPVIAAGSLIEFYLNDESATIPVGRVEYFHMGPMSFTEFLWAKNKNVLSKRLENLSKINLSQHDELIRLYHEYLIVGGMPAVVKSYVVSGSLKKARKIQESLLQTYRDDFLKYARKQQIPHLEKVFNYVAFHAGEKVKFSQIDNQVTALALRKAIDLLVKAKVIIPVYHSSCSSIPISSFVDESVFKLYFLDSGLALCAQGYDESENISDVDGFIFEQGAAQQLFYREQGEKKPELFYWLKDKTPGKAEVDFVVQFGREIYPVEIKSSTSGSLKSLWFMLKDKKINHGVHISSRPFLCSIKKYGKDQSAEIFEIPHYLIERIAFILKSEG
jgi:predicted AAA+ superfamily ATPase